MTAAWVLIFVQLSQSVPLIGGVMMNVQPIYFQTREACATVATEFNGGPEPTKDTPARDRKSFGALCRPTGGESVSSVVR